MMTHAIDKPRSIAVLHLAARRLAVALLIMALTGCHVAITEPPQFPGAIRNFLDVTVDVYIYSDGAPEETSFLVRLDPGELGEVATIEEPQCLGEGLVALVGTEEVGRMDDGCELVRDRVWVLHPEGNYTTDYYGRDTHYRPDRGG